MALINCKECKQQISDTAKTCPYCGAQPKKKMGVVKKIALAFVALAVGLPLLASLFSDKPDPSPPQAAAPTPPTEPSTIRDSRALSICHDLIMQVSRDPEKTVIPAVRTFETKNEFVFIWDRESKLLRMRNGLGLEVGVTGYCSLNKTNGDLVKLLVDGKEYTAQ